MHDENEVTDGRLLFIKKESSSLPKNNKVFANSKFRKLRVNGKDDIRFYSCSIENKSTFLDLEYFLQDYQNLLNDFRITNHKDKYKNDEKMLHKIKNSCFLCSPHNNFNKISKTKASLFCNDLLMGADFTDLVNGNTDPNKIQQYLKKYDFDKLITTDIRKLDLDLSSDSNKISNFMDDFYQNKREQNFNESVESEKIRETPKVCRKLTKSIIKDEIQNSNKNMMILFYDKQDPEQMKLMNQFENLALKNIQNNKSKLNFMRFNTSKNTMPDVKSLETKSPFIRFVRKKSKSDWSTIYWNEDSFESDIWTSSQILGDTKFVGKKSFLLNSPLSISESIQNLRMKLI
jgi:hypothetical protein